MGLTDDLTPDQRLTRIAQLLVKGAYLLAKKEGWLPPSEQPDPAVSVQQEAAPDSVSSVVDTPKS